MVFLREVQLLLIISKEMSSIKNLLNAMERSEHAYKMYLDEKKYFQAIRIFNSNKLVYSILESMLIEDNDLNKKIIINYIFHLDDWFSQFNELKISSSIGLNETFFFERIEGMIPFPINFILCLNKQ